jgi:hypothetical protein
VGGLPRLLVGLWGLGAVLLTYFGTRDYLGPKDVIEAPQVVDIPNDEDDSQVEVDTLPEDGLASEAELEESSD